MTATLFNVKDARDKAERAHEGLAKNTQTDTKTLEDRVIAEWDGALSLFHSVARSIRDIVKVADEGSASHSDVLTQFRLLPEEGCKGRAVSSSSGPCKCGSRVAEIECALKANIKVACDTRFCC